MALERLFDTCGADENAAELYTKITFPKPGNVRPYVCVNMVSTADGKIVIGEPGRSSKGVGGPTDQLLYRRIQTNADAILIGSGTLRASAVIYPHHIPRFVVTRSGRLPFDNRFFVDAPDRAWVIAPEDSADSVRRGLDGRGRVLVIGSESVDLPGVLSRMRTDLGIETLLCEGGSNLNGQLLRANSIDELFLTVAPKLKGGSSLPTPVGGEPFPPNEFMAMRLLSIYRDADELYLRYALDHSVTRLGSG